MTTGVLKGLPWVTSVFPDGRNLWQAYWMLKNFLKFVLSIANPWRLGFSDEKTMKEKIIHDKVRSDVKKGITTVHICKSVNSSNALNILTAMNIKGENVPRLCIQKYETK